MTSPGYRTVITATAVRGLHALPPRVAEPLVAFIFGSLSDAPKRRGKSLQRELAGRWAARRGDFRIIYRIDDDTRTVYVLKVARRSDVYRPQ